MKRTMSPRGTDLLEHLLQALLEITAVAAARHQRAEVERVELLARERLGHVVGDDLLGQALDDRRLADARLADENGVVLRAPRQHLHDAFDLFRTADDRVELAVAGQLGQIAAELVEDRRARRVVARACTLTRADRLLALVSRHQLDHLLAHAAEVGAKADEHRGRHTLALTDEAEEHVLGADVAVTQLQRLAQGKLEDLLGPRRERRRTTRRGTRHADGLFHLLAHGLEGDPERLECLGGNSLALVDQSQKDVLGADEAVVQQPRLFLREHQYPPCPVGETFEHPDRLSFVSLESRSSVPVALVEHAAATKHVGDKGNLVRDFSNDPCQLAFVEIRRPCRNVWAVNPTEALGLPRLQEGLRRLEPLLTASVVTGDGFLDEVTTHLMAAGGKRLRPLLALASATAGERDATDDDLMGAVAVELVHLASLYHDDVIDEATIRRNVESVNSRFGNLVAIVAGDYLLAAAPPSPPAWGPRWPSSSPTPWAGCARARSPRCVRPSRSAAAVTTTSRPSAARPPRSPRRRVESARSTGGLAPSEVDACTEYGRCFGMVFQIRDDILDITATDGQLQKPAGQDLAEGIYTLPALIALDDPDAGPDLRALLGQPLAQPEKDKARGIVLASRGIPAAVDQARAYVEDARRATEGIDRSGLRDGLSRLAAELLSDLPG